MKVLVCGSRTWADKQTIKNRLALFSKDTIIIEGAARGADTLGHESAKELGLQTQRFPADWNKYGRAAGFKRNIQMLDQLEQFNDLVIAFWDGKSRGTAHTIEQAQKRGINTETWKPNVNPTE